MPISKLIPVDNIARLVSCNGYASVSNRQSGHSTGLALSLIGRAMIAPGSTITLPEFGMYAKRDQLMQDIKHLLHSLGLKHFLLNAHKHTIVYDVYYKEADLVEALCQR